MAEREGNEMRNLLLWMLLSASLFGAEPTEKEQPMVEPPAPPEITFVQPNTFPAGSGDKVILIVGWNFFQSYGQPISVKLGDVEVPAKKIINEMRIQARITTPPHEGAKAITVQTPAGSYKLDNAIYFYKGPSLTALTYQIALLWRKGWDFMLLGGPVMWPIALCSIALVAWAIHCFLTVRYGKLIPQELVDGISWRLVDGNLDGVTELCNSRNCLLTRVLLPGLRNLDAGPDRVHELIQSAGSREVAHLRAKIGWLMTIGTISPMLGLLGTVLGMVMAFNVIAWEGAKYVLLAGAIAQALLTTVFGLVVGIPAVALYFYFKSRVLKVAASLETICEGFSKLIAQKAPIR